jgi:hypothetical protein
MGTGTITAIKVSVLGVISGTTTTIETASHLVKFVHALWKRYHQEGEEGG